MGAISQILVVGGDFAGLLAAVNLKAKAPQLRVTVLKHPVDSSGQLDAFPTTPEFPVHIHNELGIPPLEFLKTVRPIWRIGTRYQWGPRSFFDHTCEFQIDTSYAILTRESGYYVGDGPSEFEAIGSASARISAGVAFVREKDGRPQIVPGRFGYHVESARLQRFLEGAAQKAGASLIDGKVAEVLRGEMGIAGVKLESGQTLTADLYLDATGPQSLLLGQTLAVPFLSYSPALACDSAVTAAWQRTDERILPHTSVQTMDAGWSWRTEHETSIACGYAFSSDHLTPDEAASALPRLFPKCSESRLLKWRQGRREQCWAGNVVGIGSAAGFVEPLASAGPAVLAFQCQWLAQSLIDCDRILRPTILKQFNKRWRRLIETEREFLGLFYKYNSRLDTSFWREARNNAHLGSLEEVVRSYQEFGPDSIHRSLLLAENDPIGLEGYFSLLIGQDVPRQGWRPPPEQVQKWKGIQDSWRRTAANGLTVEQMLQGFLGAASSSPGLSGVPR